MDYLNDCKVVTKSLNSKMKGKERKEVIDDILSDSPQTKMLYVTPEQVCIYSFWFDIDHLAMFTGSHCEVYRLAQQFGESRKTGKLCYWRSTLCVPSK